MRTVEVSVTLDVSQDAVEAAITPMSIVQYAGTYSVDATEATDEGCRLWVSRGNLQAILEFVELADGYKYKQQGDEGPFKEMVTRVTIAGNGTTRVTVRSEFTFGGLLARVKDWYGATLRRQELSRMLSNLAIDLHPAD